MDLTFYRGKRVFVTGSTGFKGTWLCRMLLQAGAEVTGYALAPPTDPSLFALTQTGREIAQIEGDVRDLEALTRAMQAARPEIVLHLAAQPLVRQSYAMPVETYSTNIMGTVHVLEAVRQTGSVRSVVNVTTDKVYLNREWAWGYREEDPLDGYDPYSNSKSCSELVTGAYRRSFLTAQGVAVSTCRAGNVIGGGDFSADRIVPDCIRAVTAGEPIAVRDPYSVRPYQHVLEPLTAYLLVAQRQMEDISLAGSYNIGPFETDRLHTGELATCFCEIWGEGASWESRMQPGAVHEASYLWLDSAKIRARLGWSPRWTVEDALRATIEWTKACLRGEDAAAVTDRQITGYWE